MSVANNEILVDVHGRVGHLVLNRPHRHNAITNSMVQAFGQALSELEADRDVRVIVVKGAGPSFCSGFDLNESVDFLPTLGDEDELVWIEDQRKAFERLWRCRKPTIAQVHGHCVAAGGSIAGFCDIVVAAETAFFGQPESVDSGYAAELNLWPILIGPRRTKELLFTGELISGRQAFNMRMINHVVPEAELEEFVQTLAEKVAATHPQMLHYSKRLVNQVYDAMGLQSTWDFGAYVNLLGHHSEAMKKFTEIRSRSGVRAALDARGSE